MDERIEKLISFWKEIEKFKTIERECWTSNLERAESNAEHSWHLAMSLLIFEKELPKALDFTKMLRIALIHDLVEIYAGDTFAFDKEARKDKKERELKAAKKLFSQLPEDLENEFMNIFLEYENEETKEAKLMKALDKIQPIIQNLCSEGKSWKKHNLKYKEIDEYKRKYMVHDNTILKIYEKLLNEAKDKEMI